MIYLNYRGIKMEIKVDTTNLKVLGDFFQDMSRGDRSYIWMNALKKSAQPLIQAARGNIKSRSFGLYRSIGIVPFKDHTGIWIGSKVSTSTIRQGGLSKVWYGRLVEWDHRVKGKKKGQSGTKVVPGQHFFERAVNSTSDEMLNSVGNEWLKSMDGYFNKLDSKLKKLK